SSSGAGLHEHAFNWGTPLVTATGDVLYTYVYLDPVNTPSEIMLSFGSDSWEHRAYWGANSISYGTDKTASRYFVGALPAAGQWVRLEVPASALGLENASIQGMGFATFNGQATYDATGKANAASSSSSGTTSTTTSGGSTTTASTAADVAWIDDALPAGAGGAGSGGDTWNWVASPTPFSGSVAHQSAIASGMHEHYFNWANPSLPVNSGETLYAYVYLDPANTPSEIMISWASTTWEHRAYWGANSIANGTNNTA